MISYRQHEPNFDNLLKVLRREKTDRPVLFEIFMNGKFLKFFSDKNENEALSSGDDALDDLKNKVDAYYNAGFDYVSTQASSFRFPRKEHEKQASISINDGCMISDRESFENYPWIDPNSCDHSRLEKIKDYLPDGMKIIIFSPSGVLENTTALIGYDNMCYMLYEDPELLKDVFDKVGQSLLDYYEGILDYDTVGAIVVNDDWGFNTQTFLSKEHMREYVFPWHKKIVEAAHKRGKPAILHSCGYIEDVFDDIIDDMKFDGKHSFEDNIVSIEDSLEKWGDRIALLGGLDIDFFIRSSVDEVVTRATELSNYAITKGGYALGTGNSLCDYIPTEKALAIVKLANQWGL